MSFYCEWLQVTSGITTKRVRGGMSAQLGHWQDWMFVHFLLTVPLCNFLYLAPDLVLSPHCSSSVLFCFAHWHSAFPLSSHWAFPYSPATSFSCSSFSLPLQPPSHFHSILLQIWGFDINLASTFSKMFLMKAYTVVWAMSCTYFTLRAGWNKGVEESLVNLARVWFSWCPQADPPDLLHPLAVSSGHCLIWGTA